MASKRALWTPEAWDDGYPNAKGYIRVYRPDCPNADTRDGEAKRSHVVWWLHTGQGVAPGMVLHHRNRNKTDDRVENLMYLTNEQHSRLHLAERRARAALAKKRPALPVRR